MLPLALNMGIMAVNDICAASDKRRLVQEAEDRGLSVVSSDFTVGRFNANGNGTMYLSVVFLSDMPEVFEDYDLYTPEKYEESYGHYLAPDGEYACAAVNVSFPENWLLYEVDLRGH